VQRHGKLEWCCAPRSCRPSLLCRRQESEPVS
jgi:hypothetical protein